MTDAAVLGALMAQAEGEGVRAVTLKALIEEASVAPGRNPSHHIGRLK